MSAMSPSTKTVQRFAQTMHQELWLLSEILPISRFERSDSFAYNAFPCLAPGLFFMPFHGTWEFYCLICQFPPFSSILLPIFLPLLFSFFFPLFTPPLLLRLFLYT